VQDNQPRNYPLANHDAHARSVAIDAHWSQIRRTVNGRPVDGAQIALIVDAIAAGLSLSKTDVVLDLACGNGALSSYLFGSCAGLVGVDMSAYLIDVALKDFARLPNYSFCVGDAVSYLMEERDPAIFTKALIYGAFQYFSKEQALLVLQALKDRFAGVSKLFIGNIPNRIHADRFYRDRTPTEDELNDHEARVGVWYRPQELQAMAEAAGWHASISYMPTEFYASSYRFDAKLGRS
jgi:SAM-dependent methyltransferase